MALKDCISCSGFGKIKNASNVTYNCPVCQGTKKIWTDPGEVVPPPETPGPFNFKKGPFTLRWDFASQGAVPWPADYNTIVTEVSSGKTGTVNRFAGDQIVGIAAGNYILNPILPGLTVLDAPRKVALNGDANISFIVKKPVTPPPPGPGPIIPPPDVSGIKLNPIPTSAYLALPSDMFPLRGIGEAINGGWYSFRGPNAFLPTAYAYALSRVCQLMLKLFPKDSIAKNTIVIADASDPNSGIGHPSDVHRRTNFDACYLTTGPNNATQATFAGPNSDLQIIWVDASATNPGTLINFDVQRNWQFFALLGKLGISATVDKVIYDAIIDYESSAGIPLVRRTMLLGYDDIINRPFYNHHLHAHCTLPGDFASAAGYQRIKDWLAPYL